MITFRKTMSLRGFFLIINLIWSAHSYNIDLVSHLDEITAKRMRKDLIGIWKESKVTILFVTHDLSEAAILSDRVLFLCQKPAKVEEDVVIDIPRPRKLLDEEFLSLHAQLSQKFSFMEGEEEGLD